MLAVLTGLADIEYCLRLSVVVQQNVVVVESGPQRGAEEAEGQAGLTRHQRQQHDQEPERLAAWLAHHQLPMVEQRSATDSSGHGVV